MTKYPEHEKLFNIKDKSQTVGEFLDWLSGVKGYTICEWSDKCLEYRHIWETTQLLLEDFFNIDGTKLEAEKRQMLDEIRKPLDNQ